VGFRSGQWYLEDTSTNGVFINGADTPASVDGPYMLKDGDRLRVGDYEIIASIDERNDFSADASGQMPAPKIKARPAPAARPAPVSDVPVLIESDDDLGAEIDITDLLSESSIAPAANTFDWQDATGSHGASPPTVFRVPDGKGAAADKAAQIAANRSTQSTLNSMLEGLSDGDERNPLPKDDKDWQMQTRPYDRKTMTALTAAAVLGRSEKAEPEPLRRSNNLNSEAGAAVEAFCRGAGVDPSTLPIDAQTALLTLAGQMLREVVLGLMEALKGRADLKSKLRLSQTAIQPGENNPLKFSASVDEAMKKLLDPHGSRYLAPIDAIRDSFSDLRTHQLALAEAIKAASDELMNRVEPRELQEKFDRGLKRGALLGATNKMKYWDLYTEFYQVLNQRNEHGLPAVFAEELARTYAEKAAQKKR
jgi:type VI secretion system protein